MLMKNLLYTLLFLLTFYHSQADQCKSITYQQAEKAKSLIHKGEELLLWCDRCDNSPKRMMVVDSTYLVPDGGRFCYFGVRGHLLGNPEKTIDKTIDLAYAFVNSDGFAVPVAHELNLPCSLYEPALILWPVNPNEEPVPPGPDCISYLNRQIELLKRTQEMYPCKNEYLELKVRKKEHKQLLKTTQLSIDEKTNWLLIEQKSDDLIFQYSFNAQFAKSFSDSSGTLTIEMVGNHKVAVNQYFQDKRIEKSKVSTFTIVSCSRDEMLRYTLLNFSACSRKNE